MKKAKMVKDVVGVLIRREGKVLVARRMPDDSFGGMWEFPGGAVEEGETRQEALRREIREELGIDIDVGKLAHYLEDEIPDLKIKIYLFESEIRKGVPRPIECAEVRWASPDELKSLDLAPADRKIAKWLEDSAVSR